MKVAIRNLLAQFSRGLPYFRGKHRLGLPLVRLMTNYQIDRDCLVNIEMQDGSRMTLDLRNLLEQLVFLSGEHDGEIIQILSRILYPGVVIFDVGANIGLYSIFLKMRIAASN